MTPRLGTALLLLLSTLASEVALAQRFPSKPVKFVVAFPPGGNTDITARLLAKVAEPRFGQPVIVENRPGANAIIGAGTVVRADPDGYTLFVGSVAGLSSVMLKASTIDPLRDFAPVANAVRGGFVVFTRAGLPTRTLDELVAYGKANPGKLNFASSAPTTEMVFQMLKSVRGLDATSITYKGSAPALQALLAGEGDFSVDSIAAYLPHVEAGKLRAILTTIALPRLPDVPTVERLGLKNLEASWNVGVFAPAQTPAAVVSALNSSLREAVADTSFAEQARRSGGEPSTPMPDEFRRMIEAEIGFWREAARVARYEPQ